MATRAYFDNIKNEIVKELSNSDKSIKVAVAWFTDSDLFDILCKKAKKGIKVELLIANHSINHNSSIDYEELNIYGGQFSFIGEGIDNEPIMHHKFCIIDNETLIFGSYNWTNKAKSNLENISISKEDYKLIIDFYEQFEQIKNYKPKSKNKINQKSLEEICYENDIHYDDNSDIFLYSTLFLYDEIVSISDEYLIVKKQLGEKCVSVVQDDMKILIEDEYGEPMEDYESIQYAMGERNEEEDDDNNSYNKIVYVEKYPEELVPIWKFGVIDLDFNVVIPTNYDFIDFGSKDKFIVGNIEYDGCCSREYNGRYSWEQASNGVYRKKTIYSKPNIVEMVKYKYGVIDLDNNELLPCKYFAISFFDNGNFVAISDDYIKLFNHRTTIIRNIKIDVLEANSIDRDIVIASYFRRQIAVIRVDYISYPSGTIRKLYCIESDDSDSIAKNFYEEYCKDYYYGAINFETVEKNNIKFNIKKLKDNYYYVESDVYRFIFH
jgi:hypothetical protein